jgi:hypothetical protein
MTAAISRVRVNPPATTTTTCTVLNQGYKHLIAARPTIEDVKRHALEAYASGMRYAPTVRLRNGETRKIIAGTFTDISTHRIAFGGYIANGSDLVRVNVVFSGDDGGHIEIID